MSPRIASGVDCVRGIRSASWLCPPGRYPLTDCVLPDSRYCPHSRILSVLPSRNGLKRKEANKFSQWEQESKREVFVLSNAGNRTLLNMPYARDLWLWWHVMPAKSIYCVLTRLYFFKYIWKSTVVLPLYIIITSFSYKDYFHLCQSQSYLSGHYLLAVTVQANTIR